MKNIYLLLLLGLLLFPLAAQTNGNLQYMGDQAILQVWGSHFERGHAQGYLLGNAMLDVFDQYYYLMVANSSPVYYNFLWNYFMEHFDSDPRMQSESQGIIQGLEDAGISTFHNGLQRNIGAEDILLVNSIVDMLQVRNATSESALEIGCASLASWGVSTQQDSLLAGASVITRFMDWSQNSALIANPVLVVHHPSESDEQKWMSFTYPGMIGALSAINAAGTWASLNMGNVHTVSSDQGLDPVLFALRRGIERLDYDSDGTSGALDLFASIGEGLHLTGTIIHTLSESPGGTLTFAVETNNSGTVARYHDQNGDLPGNHLAATNHFRLLANPICCTRYADIQDSLYTNPHMSAKRQWRVLSGAAGQQTNLTAIQYTPSTGLILWSSASTALPAYQAPAITLSASDLFNYSVSSQDEYLPVVPHSVSLYPNPLRQNAALNLKSPLPFTALELFNLRGQKVFSDRSPVFKTEARLHLPLLPPGLYLLQLSGTAGKAAHKKLLILN
ncbi:MAG: T9SS type A sorting domain-containing protein [Candidatus Syntrophosphaera sp.]|nr:T9SS type A sorting domain-containing protein [Candidatus Syntrophosphaera sp.]